MWAACSVAAPGVRLDLAGVPRLPGARRRTSGSRVGRDRKDLQNRYVPLGVSDGVRGTRGSKAPEQGFPFLRVGAARRPRAGRTPPSGAARGRRAVAGRRLGRSPASLISALCASSSPRDRAEPGVTRAAHLGRLRRGDSTGTRSVACGALASAQRRCTSREVLALGHERAGAAISASRDFLPSRASGPSSPSPSGARSPGFPGSPRPSPGGGVPPGGVGVAAT